MAAPNPATALHWRLRPHPAKNVPKIRKQKHTQTHPKLDPEPWGLPGGPQGPKEAPGGVSKMVQEREQKNEAQRSHAHHWGTTLGPKWSRLHCHFHLGIQK